MLEQGLAVARQILLMSIIIIGTGDMNRNASHINRCIFRTPWALNFIHYVFYTRMYIE